MVKYRELKSVCANNKIRKSLEVNSLLFCKHTILSHMFYAFKEFMVKDLYVLVNRFFIKKYAFLSSANCVLTTYLDEYMLQCIAFI